MNKIYKYLLIIACGIAVGVNSLSGQRIDSLISLAWANSDKVRALEAEYQAARSIGQQVDAYPDPELSLGIGVLPVETRLGPQRLRLGATQMIPWPGMLEAKRNLAEAIAEIKSVDASQYMIEVVFQLKRSYFQLYGIRKKSKLYEEQIEILNTLKDLATTRIESGNARLSDILKIESRLIELKGMKDQLTISESFPIYLINRYSYRDMEEDVKISDTFELLTSASVVNPQISDSHPQLIKYQKMEAAAQESIALTDYQAKPKIGVGLDYIMVGQRSDALPDGNGRDIIMPMGKVSIPLNKKSYNFKRQEERLKIEAIDHLEKDFYHESTREILSAQNKIDQAVNAYNWNEAIINNNMTTIELIRTAYTSSEAGIEELLDLYMDNIRREMAQIDAIVESQIAKASIEKFQTTTSF